MNTIETSRSAHDASSNTELVETIGSLRDEVRQLRETIDSTRELVEWIANNAVPGFTNGGQRDWRTAGGLAELEEAVGNREAPRPTEYDGDF